MKNEELQRSAKLKNAPRPRGPTSETATDTSPCHSCNCKDWYDPDEDGLCDGPNVVGPTGNRCQHPIITHFA
jgi:hypothetical protein